MYIHVLSSPLTCRTMFYQCCCLTTDFVATVAPQEASDSNWTLMLLVAVLVAIVLVVVFVVGAVLVRCVARVCRSGEGGVGWLWTWCVMHMLVIRSGIKCCIARRVSSARSPRHKQEKR